MFVYCLSIWPCRQVKSRKNFMDRRLLTTQTHVEPLACMTATLLHYIMFILNQIISVRKASALVMQPMCIIRGAESPSEKKI